jgi:hypothetical protein
LSVWQFNAPMSRFNSPRTPLDAALPPQQGKSDFDPAHTRQFTIGPPETTRYLASRKQKAPYGGRGLSRSHPGNGCDLPRMVYTYLRQERPCEATKNRGRRGAGGGRCRPLTKELRQNHARRPALVKPLCPLTNGQERVRRRKGRTRRTKKAHRKSP